MKCRQSHREPMIRVWYAQKSLSKKQNKKKQGVLKRRSNEPIIRVWNAQKSLSKKQKKTKKCPEKEK